MSADAATQTQVGDSLAQLEAELTRIDVLLSRAIFRWQLAGQDPQEPFRGLHISDAQAKATLDRPFGSHWGHSAGIPAESERAFAEEAAAALRRADQLAENMRQSGAAPRLRVLANAFNLDRFDLDTLLICLAPALDLRYERLYAYLQDDVTRKRASVNLVLDLLSDGSGMDRLPLLLRFSGGAPLFHYGLLERVADPGAEQACLLAQALAVDPAVVAWLLGQYEPHADLGAHARLVPPQASAADELLAGGTPVVNTIASCASYESPTGTAPVVVVNGPDSVSLEAAARVLADKAGRPLLAVDLAALTAAGVPPLRATRLTLRDARMAGAVPYLAGWDACLGDLRQAETAPVSVVDGLSPAPELLAELCTHPDLVVVSSKAAWQATGIERQRQFFRLQLPLPSCAQREELWRHLLGASGKPGVDVCGLASQFALTAGQIRDAVAAARDRAAQDGHELQGDDLTKATRVCSNPRLNTLARQIVPRYAWGDIVLPDDQAALLHEIVATVRQRSLVLEQWGLSRKLVSSPGIAILFSGPPGTGKTMAAEVISGELGLDLYKIELSTVVSKYIGETEKNLERIFNEAQSSNAILFFDEADAIFGKRSEVKDAHDRYANIEISYLLQRTEIYDGVTILATNLRANLDEAFTRRLQFSVDFPFPEEAYRLLIWRTLFPPGVQRAPDVDLELLARRFKFSGGNIRNVLVSAAYLAANDGGCVGMSHLLHGARRELQKMGRLVNEHDIART